MPANDLLTTDGLSVTFGGVRALTGVSVSVREGEILSIIGPNGAGKTTFFNAVTGTFPPTAGKVYLSGNDITGRRPDEVARYGIARSFQNLKPFAEMTLLENVLIGREIHMTAGMLATVLRLPSFRADEDRHLQRAEELFAFAGLARRRNHLARNLTYGERKMLEIARALALEPKVLLLDEPVAGMNPTETGFVMELVRNIRAQGITVVVIEHDMRMVMGISDRIYVLDHGELIAEGLPAEVQANPQVIEAYLGEGSMLRLAEVQLHYGHVTALRGVTLEIAPGEIVTLIGANGAGKSSTLKAISGMHGISSGSIAFAGERIDRLAPHEIVSRGISHCPEGRRIFADLSVRENLTMGGYLLARNELAVQREEVLEIFPRLRERISQAGGTLSGGEQQMLAIARALMCRPRLLMLDEPSLGLSPLMVDKVLETIVNLRQKKITILLVEQNAIAALAISDRAYVLENGAVSLAGPSADLIRDERVVKAYLGG